MKPTVLAFAVVILLAACLYVPWEYTYTRPGMAVVYKPAGHYWVFDPPTPGRSSVVFGVVLDWGRLVLQLLAAGVVTGGLVAHSVGSVPHNKNKESP